MSVPWSSESEDVSDPTSPGFWDTSVLAVALFILLRGLLFLCLAFECWLYPFPFTLYFLSGKSHPVQLLQFPHVCVILTCVLLSYIYPLNSRTTLTRQLCNMNVYSKAHLRSASPLLSSFTVNGITSPNCPSRNMVSCLPLNFFLYLMTHTWYLVYSISSIPVSSVGFSPFPLLLS